MFQSNDKVVCISEYSGPDPRPVVGQVYVVIGIREGLMPNGTSAPGAKLVGLPCYWWTHRLRLLSEVKEANSLFSEIEQPIYSFT